jgi:hypothetical protein
MRDNDFEYEEIPENETSYDPWDLVDRYLDEGGSFQ